MILQDDSFDLSSFAQTVAQYPAAERAAQVDAEMKRVRGMTVRDSSKRFNQQMYITRLERLGRALAGHDVSGELTPSERHVHALLLAPPAVVAEPVATVSVAAAAAVQTPVPVPVQTPDVSQSPALQAAVGDELAAGDSSPEPVVSGPERRTSRRIQMKTRVRIRRESDNVSEVLQPVNVSRGGLGFQSPKRFGLHETVWVTMHYQAESGESKARVVDVVGSMETKSMIVRAAPLTNSTEFSYGVRFL
jgi:hypothetical protein